VRLGRQRSLAADAVDGLVARGGDEPGTRVGRGAVARPALGGDGERFLRGFFGAVEVAEEAGEGRDDTSPLLAEDLLGQCSTSGLTSIDP
jgi:hypothetical protein